MVASRVTYRLLLQGHTRKGLGNGWATVFILPIYTGTWTLSMLHQLYSFVMLKSSCLVHTSWQSVTFQKAWIFTNTASRTSNVTFHNDLNTDRTNVGWTRLCSNRIVLTVCGLQQITKHVMKLTSKSCAFAYFADGRNHVCGLKCNF
jgi:hypothetical protein